MNIKKSLLYTILLIPLFVCSACKMSGIDDKKPDEKIVYYTVTYKSDFGEVPVSKKIEAGSYLKAEDLPVIAAKGYEFENWYSGSKKITAGSLRVTENIEITAKWTPWIYSVKYTIGTGDGLSFVHNILYGSRTKLKAFSTLNIIPPPGYKFAGWSLDGITVDFVDEQEMPDLATRINQEIELVPLWKEDDAYKFSITYKNLIADDEVVGSRVLLKQFTYFEDVELPVMKDRPGYAFAGWYLTENFSGVPVTGWKKNEIKDEIVLFAKWVPVKYRLQFDANGAEECNASAFNIQTYSYEDSVTLPEIKNDLSTMQKYNAEFKGWCLNSNGFGKIYSGGQTVSELGKINNETVVLYAIWGTADSSVEAMGKVYDISLNYSPFDTQNPRNYIILEFKRPSNVDFNKTVITVYKEAEMTTFVEEIVVYASDFDDTGSVKFYFNYVSTSNYYIFTYKFTCYSKNGTTGENVIYHK